MAKFRIKSREHRRRRLRRHGRRAYIRSAYSLPSLATLGNAVCGFASMYVAALRPDPASDHVLHDYLRDFFTAHQFLVAAYLIFIAMIFDALDGRLARITRHTTDFGGQLDSLADVISFGAAPAFLALQVFRGGLKEADVAWIVPPIVSRLIWAIGALYVSCAAIRLARFNVSNEHGEQHHFSFLGLPSPGAGGTVAALVLMQQDLLAQWHGTAGTPIGELYLTFAKICVAFLPILVLATGLLMVSHVRYPHLMNRYLRGRRSLTRLVMVLGILLVLVVAHRYAMGIGMLIYVIWGVMGSSLMRFGQRPAPAAEPVPVSAPSGGAEPAGGVPSAPQSPTLP